MLYLIQSAEYGIDESGKEGFFFSLKIGYTEDEEVDLIKNRRLFSYFTYHRSIKLLGTISNGTLTHEKKLHQKFRKYLWDGNEWYYYNQEIVDYFNSLTLEELDELPIDLDNNCKIQKDIKEINRVISFLFDTIEEVNNYSTKIVNKLGFDFSFESAYNYIKDDSSIDKDKFNHYLEVINNRKTNKYCKDERLNNLVVEFMKEYDTLPRISDKLKMLCREDIKPEVLRIILSQIPNCDVVKSYFIALGPVRLRQLGCNISYIKKELGIVTFTPNVLINAIYSNFQVGEKYTLSNLKEKLRSIYNSINYKSTPKAVDIENYFKTKPAYILVFDEVTGKKKQSKGYELLESYEKEYKDKMMK